MQNPIQTLPWRFRGLGTTTLVVFAALYLPILVIVVYSFNGGRTATIWEGFSLEWYAQALTDAGFLAALQTSLIVALAAALIATILGTAIAMGLRGRWLFGQSLILGLLNLPLLVPEIVTAVATLVFFVRLGIPLGLWSLILAHAVFCIPFVFLTVRGRLDLMDPNLERAAMDLFATPFAAFRHVTLPILWPAVLSGFILAFIVSLDDFVISLFLAGPGTTTLPIYLFGKMRIGVSPEINVYAVLLMIISVSFILIANLLDRSDLKQGSTP